MKDAAERGCAGGEADGHGEHVVDHHRGGRQQARPTAQVRLGHRVGAAALGVRRDHLRVGDDQEREHRDDHDRDRHRVLERADPGGDEHEHHRFRPVGDARERVQAERGEPAEDGELVTLVGVLA